MGDSRKGGTLGGRLEESGHIRRKTVGKWAHKAEDSRKVGTLGGRL